MFIPTKEYPLIINESLVEYFKEDMGERFDKRLSKGTIIIVPNIPANNGGYLYCENEVKYLFEKYGEEETKNKVSRNEIYIYEYDEDYAEIEREADEHVAYIDNLSNKELCQEFYKTFEIEPDDETMKKWVIQKRELAKLDEFYDIVERYILWDYLINPKIVIKSLLQEDWEKVKNGTV